MLLIIKEFSGEKMFHHFENYFGNHLEVHNLFLNGK